MKQKLKLKYLSSSIAAVIFTLDTGMAFAQLDEIIVTARKREESLQDVPVTVQAFTADALEAYTTTGFDDLNDHVSGMTIYAGGPVQPSINLRGIQGNAINPAGDDSVATNLDGVQHSNAQLFRFGLFDLETVEVLKGPQALFFGKNSPGGIVSMRTKNPTEEFFSEVQLGYEDEGERAYGHVIVSGPFNDTWGGRLGVRYQDADGYFDNIWGDGDATIAQPVDQTGPDYEEYVVLGTLRGEFDRGEVTLKLYHGDRDGGQYNQVGTAVCGPLQPVANPFSDCTISDQFSAETFINDTTLAPSRFDSSEPTMEHQLTQVSLNASYEINDTWQLESVTGWIDMETFIFGNVGARPATNIGFASGLGQIVEVDVLSEELRLSGDFDNFRLMVGAFIDERDFYTGANVWIHPTVKLIPDAEGEVSGDSWSIFAQTDIDLTDTLELSLGARYSEEERGYEGRNLETFAGAIIPGPEGPHNVITPEIDTSNLSPEVTLSWQPNDDLTLFVSYKEGFKSGGYDVTVLDLAATTIPGAPAIERSYDREDVRGYELGSKWTGLDNTLRINASLFAYKYENLQQASFFTNAATGAVETRTLNAGTALVRGFEADLLWQTPVEGLTVSANIAYNDNEFEDYISACNEFQIFVDPTGCDLDVDNDLTTDAGGLLAGTGFDAQDRDGHPLRRAPEWSGSLGFEYDTSLTDALRFKANLMASYSDEYMANGENNPWGIQDSYVLFNAGLGVYAESGAWALDLISRNLNDEDVALTLFDISRSGGGGIAPQSMGYARNAPRQVMLQFTFRPDLFL